MPSSLPPFKMVHFSLDGFRSVLSGSVAIAIIGLVEAISISKSIASTSKQKIDANQEFIGQGITNIVSSFFQCFASSGSFTRSAINFYSGAKTRLAAMFSGVIIAVVLIFFSPYAEIYTDALSCGCHYYDRLRNAGQKRNEKDQQGGQNRLHRHVDYVCRNHSNARSRLGGFILASPFQSYCI